MRTNNEPYADISCFMRGTAGTNRPHGEEKMLEENERFTLNSSKSNRMNAETQQCKHCDVWFRSMGDRRQHEKSLKHQRNLGLIPPPINHLCVLCNTVIKGSNSKFRHEQTEKHKGRVKGLPAEFVVYTPLQSQSQTSPQSRRTPNPKSVLAVSTFV